MRKRGRPAFKPTVAQRRAVEQMAAVGDSKVLIAKSLKIDRETLDKHFQHELTDGAAAKRREVVENLFKQMRKGNASSTKMLMQMTSTAAADNEFTGDPAPLAPQVEVAPKAPKLGKKEQAVEDAKQTVNDPEWGTDLDTSVAQ